MDGAVGIQRYAGRVKAFLPYNRVKVAINSPHSGSEVLFDPSSTLTHSSCEDRAHILSTSPLNMKCCT